MAVIKKYNPFRPSEILYDIEPTALPQLIQIFQKSNTAFSEWKNSTIEDRMKVLNQIRQQYEDLKEDIILPESLDQGVPLFFTEQANYDVGLQYLNQYKDELLGKTLEKNITKTTTINTNNASAGIKTENEQVQWTSVGITVVILSWNLSNRLLIRSVIPSLLAGNSVIVKCSSQAYSTARQWEKIFNQCSLPKNAIQFVFTTDSAIKDLLVTHPSVKSVSFTGSLKNSVDILRKVASVSHLHFKKIQIFSGAKNAAFLLQEPTSQLAEDVVHSCLMGGGQLAWQSSKIYVLEKQSDLWYQAFEHILQKIQPLENVHGVSPWTPLVKMSQASASEVDVLDKMKQQILHDQGKVFPEAFTERSSYPPIFTKDLSKCSVLQQDELHLPVYIVNSVKYIFDMAKAANVSYYGHSAQIWGEESAAKKLAEQLDVGRVSFNQWSVYNSDFNTKYVKQSGFGLQDQRIFGDFHSNVKNML